MASIPAGLWFLAVVSGLVGGVLFMLIERWIVYRFLPRLVIRRSSLRFYARMFGDGFSDADIDVLHGMVTSAQKAAAVRSEFPKPVGQCKCGCKTQLYYSGRGRPPVWANTRHRDFSRGFRASPT